MNRFSSPSVVGVTADTEVASAPGTFFGATLALGAAAGTLVVYNGPVANNVVVASLSGAINSTQSVQLTAPTKFATLRVVVTGAGAQAVIYRGSS